MDCNHPWTERDRCLDCLREENARLQVEADHAAAEIRCLTRALLAAYEEIREVDRPPLTAADEACDALTTEARRIRAQREEEQHRKHPTGDYCVWCHSQWPCEESSEEGR